VVLVEVAVVMMPVPITCFVPKFVFGSLLIFIALDLLIEWLVLSYKKMSSLEYVVCLITFVSMVLFGVQVGLGCGLVSAMLMFVIAYSSKPAVSISNLQQSRVQRSYHERCLLIAHRGQSVSSSAAMFYCHSHLCLILLS
jgi:SulP family sulfate permease